MQLPASVDAIRDMRQIGPQCEASRHQIAHRGRPLQGAGCAACQAMPCHALQKHQLMCDAAICIWHHSPNRGRPKRSPVSHASLLSSSTLSMPAANRHRRHNTTTPPSCIKTIPHGSHSVNPTCHPTQTTLSCESHTHAHNGTPGSRAVPKCRQAGMLRAQQQHQHSVRKQTRTTCMHAAHIVVHTPQGTQSRPRASERGKTTPQTATDLVLPTRAPLPAPSHTHTHPTTQQL